MAGDGILLVRMGAMGDIIHTLPAAAALGRVAWLVKPKWAPLLEGNPAVAEIVTSMPGRRFDTAYDFQGLIKSALMARVGSGKVIGFEDPREAPAAWFYSKRQPRQGAHIVDQNLSLAGGGRAQFWLPPGEREGQLPEGRFVLACPLAGWKGKQWPLENYRRLAELLPAPLVLTGPPGSGLDHESAIPGLIDATRRAAAVVGVDSGPLHLAAAIGVPGVAIYGPTDPARHGPYGGSIKVLRQPGAATTYRRGDTFDASMLAITPEAVARELSPLL